MIFILNRSEAVTGRSLRRFAPGDDRGAVDKRNPAEWGIFAAALIKPPYREPLPPLRGTLPNGEGTDVSAVYL